MQWHDIENRWQEYAAQAQRRWSHLTPEDITAIGGNRDRLVERIRASALVSQEVAEREVGEFAIGLRLDGTGSHRPDAVPTDAVPAAASLSPINRSTVDAEHGSAMGPADRRQARRRESDHERATPPYAGGTGEAATAKGLAEGEPCTDEVCNAPVQQPPPAGSSGQAAT